MGMMGMLLKRKEDIAAEKVWDDVIKALDNAGYVYDYDQSLCQLMVYEYRYSNKHMEMFLHHREKDSNWDDGSLFEWMGQGDSLFRVVMIDVRENEDMILHFVHEYLKMNPNDFYWGGGGLEWYYTKEDIDRIIEKKYDPIMWCYTNPAEI